jgi:hypothetical protein
MAPRVQNCMGGWAAATTGDSISTCNKTSLSIEVPPSERATPPWSAKARYDLGTLGGTPSANTCLALSMIVGYGIRCRRCLIA